jgi:hypothetical protein
MPLWKSCPLHRIPWARAALAVLVVLAAAAPAAAAGKDYEGFFGVLDVALTQPNSLDQHFADSLVFSGSGADYTRHVLDNDADSTFRIQVGYSFGKGLGSIRASYWSFENDDSQSMSIPGGVYPTVFGSSYYTGRYGSYVGYYYLYNAAGVSVIASSKVKASTLDLDYIGPMVGGNKVSVNWLAGLRRATYEEDQTFDGDDGTYYIVQGKHFESNALGIRVGAKAAFELTRRFRLEGEVGLSLLQADSKGDSFQIVSERGVLDTNHGEDDNTRGEIRDLDVRGVWDAGPLDFYVGYAVSSWEGLVSDPVPGAAGFSSVPGRDSISFNSIHGGVIWRFGSP